MAKFPKNIYIIDIIYKEKSLKKNGNIEASSLHLDLV